MFLRTIIKAFAAQLITLKPLMVKQQKKPEIKPKATYSIAEAYGYTHKDFKKWGKQGGRPAKYVNDKERYKAYRRRKNQAKLASGEKIGLLNMTTGRINKYRTKAERQRAYRLRKKLETEIVYGYFSLKLCFFLLFLVKTRINKVKKSLWQISITLD